jgi:hypothetical protein
MAWPVARLAKVFLMGASPRYVVHIPCPVQHVIFTFRLDKGKDDTSNDTLYGEISLGHGHVVVGVVGNFLRETDVLIQIDACAALFIILPGHCLSNVTSPLARQPVQHSL